MNGELMKGEMTCYAHSILTFDDPGDSDTGFVSAPQCSRGITGCKDLMNGMPMKGHTFPLVPEGSSLQGLGRVR